jgi:membrane associated rhomboid family serine protease
MTPWVTRIIFANVAMFILAPPGSGISWELLLVPELVPVRPWTPITYMFLHGGFIHLLFNMLALYFFGPRLEVRLGGGRFLGLYFASGIMGAALSFVFTPQAYIVGASGAVFGVLLAYARYWPRHTVLIWGILPVEARWLVIGFTVLSLASGFRGVATGAGDGVAHFAHLGGFLGGYLYIKWMEWRSPARQFQKKAKAPLERARPAGSGDLKKWSEIRPEDLHPVNREELDRILAKIKESGVSSLSPSDRAFLDRFSPG